MTVQQAAIAGINDPEAKASGTISVEDACFKMAELAQSKDMGYILSDEEYTEVRDCLATIGNAEDSVSEDGSLQGKGHIEYDIEGQGISVRTKADLSCTGVWDRTRMEWVGSMGVQKIGGDAEAVRLRFTYRYLSFGMSPDNKPELQYNYSFVRDQNANEIVSQFNKGEVVESTHIGTSNNVQWGYCIIVSCKVVTSESTIIV